MLATILARLAQRAFVIVGLSVLVFLIFFVALGSDPAARIAAPGTVADAPEVRLRPAAPLPAHREKEGAVHHAGPHRPRQLGPEGHPPGHRRHPRDAVARRGAAVLWVLGSLAVGVAAAAMRDTVVDRGLMILSLSGVSTPVFWLGEVMNLSSLSRLHDT